MRPTWLKAFVLCIVAALSVGEAPTPVPPDIGSLVPEFEVTSLDGRTVSLRVAVTENRAVVVVFLSTVCPYAKYFARHLRELAASYRPRGVLFVGVYSNSWESGEEVAKDARERAFGFSVAKDEGHTIADLLGATRTPEALLVDSEGRLRYRGWVKSKQESPDLKRALDAVLAGRPVPKPATKAFGCAIDRS